MKGPRTYGALALVLALGCAHAPPPPRVNPCAALEDPNSRVRFEYSGPEWVTGLGQARIGVQPDEARQKAVAAAANEIASQLLVRLQSTLDVTDRVSTTGFYNVIESQIRTEVAAAQLPGLQIVATCTDPVSLSVAAFVVLHRERARAALSRLVMEEGQRLYEEAGQAMALVERGEVVSTLGTLRRLRDELQRWRANAQLAVALGHPAEEIAAPIAAIEALATAIAQRRVAHVEVDASASGGAFASLLSNLRSAVTAAGWRLDARNPVLTLRLSVDACAVQPVPALGAVRVHCGVSVGLVDTARGEVARSLSQRIEGIGRGPEEAAHDGVRKAGAPLARQLEALLAELEQ